MLPKRDLSATVSGMDMIRGLRAEEEIVRIFRSIYHRDRLNYGAPMAWPTYKSGANPAFIEFMEEQIVKP